MLQCTVHLRCSRLRPHSSYLLHCTALHYPLHLRFLLHSPALTRPTAAPAYTRRCIAAHTLPHVLIATSTSPTLSLLLHPAVLIDSTPIPFPSSAVRVVRLPVLRSLHSPFSAMSR